MNILGQEAGEEYSQLRLQLGISHFLIMIVPLIDY